MQNKNRQIMNDKSKQELLGYQSHLIRKNLKYFKPTKNSYDCNICRRNWGYVTTIKKINQSKILL